MDLLEEMVESRLVMDSQGRLRGNVEVEHASGPDPYDSHPEASGNLELGIWGPDWQDGTEGIGVNQRETYLEHLFDLPEVAREAER